jgi:xeroderma pigmentosum group C-complementing protein
LTPLALQNAFAVIHKSRIADANQRGRLFESAIERLTEWWCNSFFSVEPVGHIRSRTFNEVQKMVAHLPPLGEQDTLDVEALEDEEECEVLHTSKSLMKHALMRGGSRDVSAQLFTSLCRALGIPARLVVSLQSVPWQAGVGKSKPKSAGKKKDVKGKGKEKALDDEDKEEKEDNDMEEVDTPSTFVDVKGKAKADDGAFVTEGRRLDGQSVSNGMKGKEKAKPVIRLRKQKSKGNVLGSSSSPAPRRESMSFLDPNLFSSHTDPCSDTGSNNHTASILD